MREREIEKVKEDARQSASTPHEAFAREGERRKRICRRRPPNRNDVSGSFETRSFPASVAQEERQYSTDGHRH